MKEAELSSEEINSRITACHMLILMSGVVGNADAEKELEELLRMRKQKNKSEEEGDVSA
jgi:hypothetical protein